MAERYGKNALVLVGKESAYGTVQTTPTHKHACMCVATTFVNPTDTQRKNQTLEPQSYDKLATTTGGTVVLSGDLTPSMDWLIQAYLMDESSPYLFQTEQSNFSYTIMQAFPAGTADAGDGMRALGCRLESLVFTGTPSGAIQFTATFRARAVDFEVAFDGLTLGTVTNTTAPNDAPFLYPNVVSSLVDDALEYLNSFTMTFTNEFAPDEVSYQNSVLRIADRVCKQSAQLDTTWIYDTAHDADVYDNLVGTLDVDVISFHSGDNRWAFTTYGKYMTYDNPEPGVCLLTGHFVKELMGDAAENALSIIVI